MKTRLPIVAAAVSLFSVAAFAQSHDTPFQVRYAANLNIGDSVINLTNTGFSSTTAFPTQNGNICANVYVFDPQEEEVACCACPITPNALKSLSVKNDLLSNPAVPGPPPNSVVIKLLASTSNASQTCNPAQVGATGNTITAGLAAWGTTIHALPVTAATPATTFGVTETAFTPSTLLPAELVRMVVLCQFIQTNGSGTGICNSCRLGGLGAQTQ